MRPTTGSVAKSPRWPGLILALTACASAPRAAQPAGDGTRFPDAAQIIVAMPGDSLPRPARLDRGPTYPVSLRNAGITGQLVAAFVIDTAGQVELRSISFVEPSGHPEFQRAVCEFLRNARFVPGRTEGGPRRTLVFMPFAFSLSIAPPLGPRPDVKSLQLRAQELPRAELVAELESRPHC